MLCSRVQGERGRAERGANNSDGRGEPPRWSLIQLVVTFLVYSRLRPLYTRYILPARLDMTWRMVGEGQPGSASVCTPSPAYFSSEMRRDFCFLFFVFFLRFICLLLGFFWEGRGRGVEATVEMTYYSQNSKLHSRWVILLSFPSWKALALQYCRCVY